MNHKKHFVLSAEDIRCFLLIFLGFFLTSCGYLSWVYHLGSFFSSKATDLLTMSLGYTVQALGIGLFALGVRSRRELFAANPFIAAAALDMLCTFCAVLGSGKAGSLCFGLLMNLLCGIIAGFYLHALLLYAHSEHRAFVFGAGYAAATLAGWLLSLPGQGSFLNSRQVLWVYLILTVCLAAAGRAVLKDGSAAQDGADPGQETASLSGKEKETLPGQETASLSGQETASLSGQETASLSGKGESRRNIPAKEAKESAATEEISDSRMRRLVVVCALTLVYLMSFVKNIGFTFPYADVLQGVSLELMRVLYAAGLLAAGLINDKDRRFGAVCALAALVTPFIILALSGEGVIRVILWGLDYFIFGFLSVYRVVLSGDLAGRTKWIWLSGFGLLFGRLGDASGTLLSTLLAGHITWMVVIAAVLFTASVFVFFQVYQLMYLPSSVRNRTEKERFEHFAYRHDLSAREREVLRLLLDDRTNAEIAAQLYVSESTVKFHVHNLYVKTGFKSRAELKAAYYRDGQ